MASQQSQPTMRKLTKEESELRRKEDDRKKKQWYSDTLTKLETYHNQLMRFLLKGNKSPFPDTDPLSKVSLEPSPQQEVVAERALRAMADVETIIELAVIPSIKTTKAQHVQFPLTENVEWDEIQGQVNALTTFPHEDELSPHEPFDELIAQGQAAIRKYYHAQKPKRMPTIIWVGALNYFILKTHYSDGFFPETNKRVRIDYKPELEDRIICE
jgi:hypothetical protein